nr:chloride channel CLIC-like protein 1 isoform X2 [Doryrhamphus excisus]
MLLVVLFAFLALTSSQEADDDWIDPYDMLNYDATTKTMRKLIELVRVSAVQISSRDDVEDSGQAEATGCDKQLALLQSQVEVQEKRMKHILQQPTCNPVFKRFLSRLLKDIHRLGLPPDSTDVLYDAQIRLSRQAVSEIQTLLDGGEDSWRTGALDNAVSQILVDLRPHDHEAWRWRFEDTFGVELDIILKLLLAVACLVVMVCTQLWSSISWLLQFRRFFVICFFISIVWNWLYLYKIAFAEHQSNMAKMDSANNKCTGVKTIDWSDSLKEWFRSTWTLQDDPCKKYYEVLMVNPILLVPPTKAISVTFTTFVTEPLKHVGQGISEFLRALLKDLPITLQIPVLLTIVLGVVVCVYGSVQATFQYGITAPLRHRNPPPLPEPDQPRLQPAEGCDGTEGRNARTRNEAGPARNRLCREERAGMLVETLHYANASTCREHHHLDGGRQGQRAEEGQGDGSDPQAESQEVERPAKTKRLPRELQSSPPQPPKDGGSRKRVSVTCKRSPDEDGVEDRETSSAGDSAPSTDVETLGSPVQESTAADMPSNDA